MERRSFLHGANALGLGVVAAATTAANAQTPGPTGIAAPVSGRTANGEIVGIFRPSEFIRGPNGGLLLQGLLNMGGAVTNQTVQLPVTLQQNSCTILELHLGPLSLNLLGLQIDLSRIDLVITAIPGGGLLGDLLCAIADILSGPGAQLNRLISLLNQLLALFR
jgi:hypothetical protein